jgi:hypothetical protein
MYVLFRFDMLTIHWTGFWAWQLTRERTSLSCYRNKRLPSRAGAAHGPPLVQYGTVLFLWYSTFKRNAAVKPWEYTAQ